MKRFHYCFATDFIDSFPALAFANPGVDIAAGGFVRNILRIQSLGRLPILLTGAAIVTEKFDALAIDRLGMRQDAPELFSEHPSFNPHRWKEKEALRRAMQAEWFNATKTGEATSGMETGEEALSVMVPAGGLELEEGIDAMLCAMVIETWTAFEVLAESVWNAVDTARPNLKQSLQGKRGVGLRSTFGIRNRYALTFATDSASIMGTLNDTRIEALALVRNLIVHLGGKKDSEFETRGKSLVELAYFFSANAPAKIKLTGPVVLDLIKPISTLGLALAISVDNWLVSHP